MSNRPNHKDSSQEVLNDAKNSVGALDVVLQVETSAGVTVPAGYQAPIPTSEKPLPLATNTTSTLTLTDASTAYQITEPTSKFLVVFTNRSGSDISWGFATPISGGEIVGGDVLADKEKMALVCEAGVSPYFACAVAGKVLNYTTTVL